MIYLIYSKKKHDVTDRYKLVGETMDKEYHEEVMQQLTTGIFHEVLDIIEKQQPWYACRVLSPITESQEV